MPFLKRSSSSHMNISLPIMDANEFFPSPQAATSSWNNLSRPLSIRSYSNDLSDELLAESPSAISKYMTNASSHSGNSSKLSRHNSERRKLLSGLKSQSQLTKRASMQLDEHRSNNHNQSMSSSISSFNIGSSYMKSSSSTFSLSLQTPPKIEINIDNSLFDDFYANTTASLSEAAGANLDIVRVIPNTTDNSNATEVFGLVSPAPSTETFESAGYSMYDDSCTQYSAPSSINADSSSCRSSSSSGSSSHSCFKSSDINDATTASSFVTANQGPLSSTSNTNDCTSSHISSNNNHTTSSSARFTSSATAPAVSSTGTLWVGGSNSEDCLTKQFIHEPVLFAEYDDDDEDLDHLVCYTKLRPRMASFAR